MAASYPGREAEPPPSADDLRAIPLLSLCVDTAAGFDIFVRTRRDRAPILYRRKNLPITESVLARLADHRHTEVFVRRSDERAYHRYLEENLPMILADDSVDVPEKAEVLYECAQGLMEEVMAEPRSGAMVKRSRALVESTVGFMKSERTSFRQLLRVVSYDYYTYTHSVNVFVFAIALAQRVGYDDPDTLKVFGEGALLHDVGKSDIDPSILNCRAKLSARQWDVMKRHPEYGLRILASQGGFDEIVLDIVRHHHEKLNGTGYPDGLADGAIGPLVRIVTIADIFDALTTHRSYKRALESFAALMLMREEMSEELDPHLFRAFIRLMGDPDEPGT